MNDELLQLVITMAWCMWFNRNVVRQCKTQQLVAEILQNAKYLLEEFQMANFMLACHETYDILEWIPLTQSWYKINTNGATFVNTQSVGDGVIIRDNKGQVEAALSKNLPILLGPTEIEAKSLEEGVLFVWDVSVQDMMVLESDSKIVVVLIGTSETLVAIDNNIGKIRAKLQAFRCVEISHAKRDGNCPTHFLAKYAKYLESYQTQIGENSYIVESALADDVLLCISSS